MNVGCDRFGLINPCLSRDIDSRSVRGREVVTLDEFEDSVCSQDRTVLVRVWNRHLRNPDPMEILCRVRLSRMRKLSRLFRVLFTGQLQIQSGNIDCYVVNANWYLQRSISGA